MTSYEKKVYLAGPMDGRTDDECRIWRRVAAAMLQPLESLDPVRRDYRYTEVDRALAAKIVDDDKADILASAAVLVHYDRPSVGTSMEIMFAFQHDVPVYLLNVSGTARISPWLIHHARGRVFYDMPGACAAILQDVLGIPARTPT